MTTTKRTDIVDAIIDYECGALDLDGVLGLFSELIRTGQAWQLQGSYGRTARYLIDEGVIAPDGTIDHDRVDDIAAGF